jgi:hypothetical protein
VFHTEVLGFRSLICRFHDVYKLPV